MRDGIVLDPVDPPEGVELSEAEALLYDGRCPECGAQSAFAPSEEWDGSLVCLTCKAEFDGPETDKPDKTPVRKLDKVYKRGERAKLRMSARKLPPVVERTRGRGRELSDEEREGLKKMAAKAPKKRPSKRAKSRS